jgi:hypothetical protein
MKRMIDLVAHFPTNQTTSAFLPEKSALKTLGITKGYRHQMAGVREGREVLPYRTFYDRR